jgi:hypothetical protein
MTLAARSSSTQKSAAAMDCAKRLPSVALIIDVSVFGCLKLETFGL